ncbi:MAG TPA: PspC domain-containing protein [Candidatus Limnocylindria bacterium]|nr:PspC domain-containing protein [Candidatus Limnocylindria bacterium]
MNRRLYRSATDRKIGGVAAGTATYFDIDPSISRVLWLLLAIFTGGAFVIVYIVMWAIVPEEPWQAPALAGSAGSPPPAEGGETPSDGPPTEEGQVAAVGQPVPASNWSKSVEVSSGPGPHIIFGAILILIGGWFLVQQFVPWLNFGTLWPIGLVVVGVIILAAALRRGG